MGNENYGDNEVIVLVDEDGNEVIVDSSEESNERYEEAMDAATSEEIYEEEIIYEEPVEEIIEEVIEEPVEEATEEVYEEIYEETVEEAEESREPARDYSYFTEPMPDYSKKNRNTEYDDSEEGGMLGTIANKMLLVLGALVAVIAIGVGIFALSKRPKAANPDIDFQTVGSNMASIGIVGIDNINAITEAQGVKLDDLYEAVKNYDYDEADAAGGVTTVSVQMTSILKDLKIKFVNSKGKLIANVPFEIEVTGPDGKTIKWSDTDKDGIIYQTDLSGGAYSVKLLSLSGYDKYYDFSDTKAQSISVKTQLDYQKVDVKNEIKKADQVAASEDAVLKETVVESKLQDTVTFVLSEKVQNSNSFVEIDRTTVTDPMVTLAKTYEASLFRFKRLSGPVVMADVGGDGGAGDEGGAGAGDAGGAGEGGAGGAGEGGAGEGGAGEGGAGGAGEGGAGGAGEGGAGGAGEGGAGGAGEGGAGGAGEGGAGGAGEQTPPVVDPTPAHVHSYSSFKSIGNGKHAKECTAAGSCDAKYSEEAACTLTLATKGTDASRKHTRKCDVCGYTVTDDCTFTYSKVGSDADKTHKRKCTTCGYEYSESCNTSSGTCACGYTITKGTATQTISGANTVVIGKSIELTSTVTVNPSTIQPKAYSWTVSSEDAKVVTLGSSSSNKVTVTGKAKGTATVTCVATLNDTNSTTVTSTIKITVTDAGISLDRTSKKAIFVNADPFTLTATTTGGVTNKVTWSVSDSSIAKIEATEKVENGKGVSSCKITGLKAGTVTVTVKSSDNASVTASIQIIVSDPKGDKSTKLTDTSGKQVFVYDSAKAKYVEATYSDYYTGAKLFTQAANEFKYTGWWTIDGKTYYYDQNGNKVKGEQVICGAKYSFDDNGVLKSGTGQFGIDVSTWNGSIDWNKVAKSGVSFAIIRCGFRGTTIGGLVEDAKFEANISGATKAGIKVGVYFFTQAVSEAEAVEEASMCMTLVNGYNLKYPIFIDVESANNGRANGLSKEERTAIIKAFCKTVTNGGYKAGVYANKNWLTTKINASELTSYVIWLAQYAQTPTYTSTRYDMWQYSDKGSINGISGNVDLDLSYLGY